MTNSIKVPISFWIISGIALLWNAMGCYQWFVEYGFYTNPESRITIEEAVRPMYDSQPIWLYVVFAIAVLAGLIGSIGLLLRKSWSDPVFLISLISVIILHGYTIIATDHIQQLGTDALVIPILVILLAAFLLYYAKKNKALGILT